MVGISIEIGSKRACSGASRDPGLGPLVSGERNCRDGLRLLRCAVAVADCLYPRHPKFWKQKNSQVKPVKTIGRSPLFWGGGQQLSTIFFLGLGGMGALHLGCFFV